MCWFGLVVVDLVIDTIVFSLDVFGMVEADFLFFSLLVDG